ncbi:hypothetical protein GGI12_003343 [Dipsacomyces acuminosporus]|nr:hypothetical protein GGI12_003343 [Dipsacomyces acuminosporus]
MKISILSGTAMACALFGAVSEAASASITPAQLNRAFPVRAAEQSCDSLTKECAVNSRAAVSINKALKKYNISRRSEVVAVIALMAFESGTWEYNVNHYPGRPGQGTRSMLMYNFVKEYAAALHPGEVSRLAAGNEDDNAKNAVRELVLNNDDSFGSGFWYLTAKAKEYHNNPGKLRDGNADDFKDYVLNGVHAGWDDTRMKIWTSVNSAIAN